MNWRFSKAGWQLLPGGLVALGFAILLKLGALQPLEQMVYNTFFALRGEAAWDDRLVLVTIDDTSLNQLGRFPWSRQQYIKLLNVLTQGDPSIIAFDLLWSEASPDDVRLAAAMQQYGRVVLASAKQQQTGLPLPPTAILQEAAIGTGHILHDSAADGVTRRVLAQVQGEPQFALAVAKAYSLVEAPVTLPEPNATLWVNWAGRSRSLQQYSFVDVVQGKVPPQRFQNKIVLVGVTATGLDQLVTPFDRNPPASGLHLQAAVLHNLLQGNLLQPIAYGNWLDGARLLILVLGGPGLSLLLCCRRAPLQIAIWLVGSVGWTTLSLIAFSGEIWLPVAMPLSLFTATLITTQLVEQLRTNALLQSQIKHLWQQYQADLVLRSTDQCSPPGATTHGAPMSSITQLATIADQFGRSQSTQAAIARSLSIGLVASDLDGCVWFCNPVAALWLSMRVGEQLETRLVPQWMSPEQWQADRQALQHRRPIAVQEVRQGDRWIALKIEPLSYEPAPKQSRDRSLDGLLIVLEDITVRKHAEAVLAQQVEELQRLSQMKDDFLSTVSHELRAPLTNFRLAIDLLAISDSETERAHYLEILERECTRETELINDLLDLQRLEANARQRELENIQLQTWLPTIVEPFRDRSIAQQQTLKVSIAPQIPAIASDPHSLKRILVELVNNACKYTPPAGEIRVTAQSTPPYIELVVSNTGVEIPPTELGRIFDKFYRVPKADQWQRGGTGLGLALVKKLVEHLSGTIHVRSGAGLTTFTVQLPFKPEAAHSLSTD
jgi:signal transduction histidine kinase/CHASE2 domain-containing sensor protein